MKNKTNRPLCACERGSSSRDRK